ncbi:MAG: hypothetical protein FJ356_02295 [Thaumarchaeota archaeon]|nr:hypothetical protein [Nitrososphaerota archaeon]
MTLPTIKVEIDFASGPSFAYPFILDSPSFGILDTNILADGPTDLEDVTDRVRKVTTRRGRNRLLSQFEAGTATVVLNDPNSDFSPTNEDSIYWDPVTNSTKVLPLRKIRIYAETEVSGLPITVPMFAGYISSYDTSFYQGTTADATVTLNCVDGFRLFSNVSTGTAPVPGCTSGQLSGARITSLLEFGDFPDSMMFFTDGQSQMQVDPGGNRSLLQAIQTIEQSEFGAFFMGRDGRARFLDRNTISSFADFIWAEYSDINPLPAGKFPYALLDFAYDDQQILNDVSVQAKDGPVFTNSPSPATDLSIERYGYKSATRNDLLMFDTTEAEDQANMIVATRREADIRIDSMKLNMNATVSESNVYNNLALDLFKTINITKTMPGTIYPVTKEVFVQGVVHEVSPGQWNITVYTAEPIIQAFILDSSTQGLLDINALSY